MTMEHLDASTQRLLCRAVLFSSALDEALLGASTHGAVVRAVYDYARLLPLVEQVVGAEGDLAHRAIDALVRRASERFGGASPIVAQITSERQATELAQDGARVLRVGDATVFDVAA